MAELLFDWIVLNLSSKYFRNDSRTDRNEQLQLNDTLLDKTQMFYARNRRRYGSWIWFTQEDNSGICTGVHTLCCGQSYKGSTIVNYDSRVVKWGIFKSGTTLES